VFLCPGCCGGGSRWSHEGIPLLTLLPVAVADLDGRAAYPRSVAPTSGLDLSDEAIAGRVKQTNQRVFAGYMGLQATVGVLFWVALLGSSRIRSAFDLMPAEHAVTDAFFLADLLVGVVGSAIAAWGLWAGARWAVPVVAFTTGGIVYPTLFLVCWVAMVGTGEACLAIMLPPTVLSSYVAWRTWVIDRS
jgi:hypothetical protein